LTKYQVIGRRAERCVSRALDILKIEHLHNPFDRDYAKTTSLEGFNTVDILSEHFAMEIKNLNGAHKLTRAWLNEEVVSRFRGYTDRIKYLVVSVLNIPYELRKYLWTKNIRVMEIGFQITDSNYKWILHYLIKHLAFLKHIVNEPMYRVEELVSKSTSKSSELVGNSRRVSVSLVSYCTGSVVVKASSDGVRYASSQLSS